MSIWILDVDGKRLFIEADVRHGTGRWTMLGGTGSFEGVTGEGTAEGDADFETNTFALTLTGIVRKRS